MTQNKTVAEMWVRAIAAIVVVGAAGVYFVYESGHAVPPPVNNRAHVEFVLEPGCALQVTRPGEEVDVHVGPRQTDMIVGSIPHGTALEFASVRVDWVEVTAPVEGWISRRAVRTVCP